MSRPIRAAGSLFGAAEARGRSQSDAGGVLHGYGMAVREAETESPFLAQSEFEGITFRGEVAIGLDLRDRKFIDCTFERCQLSSVRIDGAVIQAKFVSSKVEGINFFTAKRTLLTLSFDSCLIRHSSFAELKLREIAFTRCEFRNVDFAEADLSGADFSNSTFEDCIFRNTNLSKADFRYAAGILSIPRKTKFAALDFPRRKC